MDHLRVKNLYQKSYKEDDGPTQLRGSAKRTFTRAKRRSDTRRVMTDEQKHEIARDNAEWNQRQKWEAEERAKGKAFASRGAAVLHVGTARRRQR